VDVGVDEARGDQRILVVGDFDVGISVGSSSLAWPRALMRLDHQQAVFEVFRRPPAHLGGVGDAVQDGGAVGFAGNGHEYTRQRLGCAGKAAATAIWPALAARRAGRSRRCRWR
jgi:hypothetical protein